MVYLSISINMLTLLCIMPTELSVNQILIVMRDILSLVQRINDAFYFLIWLNFCHRRCHNIILSKMAMSFHRTRWYYTLSSFSDAHAFNELFANLNYIYAIPNVYTSGRTSLAYLLGSCLIRNWFVYNECISVKLTVK